jgi:hypothetical protein
MGRAPPTPNPLANTPGPPARTLRVVPVRIGQQALDIRALGYQPAVPRVQIQLAYWIVGVFGNRIRVGA